VSTETWTSWGGATPGAVRRHGGACRLEFYARRDQRRRPMGFPQPRFEVLEQPDRFAVLTEVRPVAQVEIAFHR
jgi:hypothetical protein